MQPTEKPTLILGKAFWDHFPKGHMLAAGGLILCLGIWASTPPSKSVTGSDETITVAIPAAESIIDSMAREEPKLLAPQLALPQTEQPHLDNAVTDDAVATAAIIEPPALEHRAFTVKSGDSLSAIFQRAGLSDRDVYELTHKNKEANRLTRIMPGHEIIFYLDTDTKLQKLTYITDRLNSVHFVRDEKTFVAQTEARQPDILPTYKEATISSSLFLAGQAVGMHDSLIMEFANIFGWDVDFALDIRKGDHFSVLYEEKFLDGEKIGNGAILAAEFTNQGHKFRAVRYTHTDGVSHYYTPDGASMRKAFLLAPLDFRRISGNFNPKRLHPIFKTVRPHRGTDYAANRGTPVWASGDGRVTASAYSKPNGNYVFIQHGNNVVTKYLHLHKRFVKQGERVRQKQVIGSVGSTGYSTAPHLHYEFLLDGVHRNPRTIVQKLPKAQSVPAAEMARFQAQTQQVVAQLEQYSSARQLALGAQEHSIN